MIRCFFPQRLPGRDVICLSRVGPAPAVAGAGSVFPIMRGAGSRERVVRRAVSGFVETKLGFVWVCVSVFV